MRTRLQRSPTKMLRQAQHDDVGQDFIILSEAEGLVALTIISCQERKAPDLQSDFLYFRGRAEIFQCAVGAVGAAGDAYCPAVVDK